MSEQQIISCPNCGQKLRTPQDADGLKLRCPTCEATFFWNKGLEFASNIPPSQTLKTEKSNMPLKGILIIAGMLLVGLFFTFVNSKTGEQPITLNNNRAVSESSAPVSTFSKFITISYSDLLDKNAIIRTGEELRSALKYQELRGTIQPFVDKYSYLLQYSIEMIFGPDSRPQNNIVDHYPLGSKQPNWVAILRGGRVFLSTDNQNHTRVFLIGDDPKEAYKRHYSVIRHCLSGLLPDDGSNLTVEVFAYRNNYLTSELKLNLKPHILEASSFPLPPNIQPLDLLGMEEFFNAGGILEGGELDEENGLILYARKGSRQTIESNNVSLADFAVAYRAVFHAGDNEAFISLDPNKDVTKTTVNFGGFLEDTRIGSVVLKADQRFKTITAGLDPHSFKDTRKYTRQYVPTFLTVSERELLEGISTEKYKWVGTRFWFYPESIEVESDFNFKHAKIVKPFFTADAERSREDFISPEEFERKKQATLSPSIQKNIDHLNQNYSQYEKAYPELEELTCVARLMGICSWLKRANPEWLDLDALLSVQLPPFRTDRETTQMLAVSLLTYIESNGLDESYVRRNAIIKYMSEVLDKTVKSYFSNTENIARYLCYKNNIDEKIFSRYDAEAKQLMLKYASSKVRELINSQEELMSFMEYASSRIDVRLPATIQRYSNEIESAKGKLEQIEGKLESMKIQMNNADGYLYNSYVDEYNQLVSKYESIRLEYNRNTGILNRLIEQVRAPTIVEIGGGINLEPKHFTIKKTSTSAKLKKFQSITSQTNAKWSSINNSGQWIRNSIKKGGSSYKTALPMKKWISKSKFKSNGSSFEHMTSEKQQSYWVSTTGETGSWQDMYKLDDISFRERMFDGSKNVIHIAEYKSKKLSNYITGTMVDDNRIVFSRSTRKDLIIPEDRPIWWVGEKQ